jgi:AAA domain
VNTPIDFDGINAAALRNARSLLPDLIPGGKFRSLEYVVLNPRRDDQHPGSFSINYKTGAWKDFASDDGGSDMVSLVAFSHNCSQGEAARWLADKLGAPLYKPGHKSNAGDGTHLPSSIAGPASGPAAADPAEQATKVYNWGDAGPPARPNEVRRHFYPSDDFAMRVKVKLDDGSFVNWYRVLADSVPTGWQAKKPQDYRAIPYRSGAIDPFDSELIADEIYWPEGEKDVDTLSRQNLPAFTFGGVGDGLPSGIEHYLKDRHLVILADNDDPGREHAEKKAAFAYNAAAASIKVVRFPELPPKADVSDFLATGGTASDLTLRVDASPPWSPPAPRSPERIPPSDWRSKAIRASDLQNMTFAPVRYVLPGYVSEGVSILAGKPKVGKSWLTFDLCIAAAAGRLTLGTLKPLQGDVLYLALEDSNRRLKGRMAKLLRGSEGRWPERLTLTTEWRRADEGGLADIENWCKSVSLPVLIVIDTLEKFRPLQNGKTPAYSADYQAITGLQKIAGELGIAIVINHHVRKMEAEDPFDTVSGTLGLTGAADTILVLKRQSGAVTLHARGRDIEESETALQFDRGTCRWTILGAAADVHMSQEQAAVLKALEHAGADGLAVSEIMAATGSNSRGAMDTLLFKMKEAGKVTRVKRGIYALAKDTGKTGQKERNGQEMPENIEQNSNLPNLTDLTALEGIEGGLQ